MNTHPLLPGRKRRGKWDHLAWELQKTPGQWVPWPNQHTMTPGVRETYNNRIRTGRMWGPGYTSEIRDGWLYIQYPHPTTPNGA